MREINQTALTEMEENEADKKQNKDQNCMTKNPQLC